MKLALIGVGQAGGKVVDEFLAYDARTGADVVRGRSLSTRRKRIYGGSIDSLRIGEF